MSNKTAKPKAAKKEPKAAPKKADPDKKKPPKPPKTFKTKGVESMETFLQSIQFKLTAKEKDERNESHTRVWKEIGSLELEKKIFNDNKNAEIKEKKAEFDELMRAMEKGTEDREVRVGLFPVFTKNIVYTVRLDTDEIVSERTMTPQEKERLTKKPATVTKLSSVKDENQVKADAAAAGKKASEPLPETSDGGKAREKTAEEKRQEEDDKAWTEDD